MRIHVGRVLGWVLACAYVVTAQLDTAAELEGAFGAFLHAVRTPYAASAVVPLPLALPDNQTRRARLSATSAAHQSVNSHHRGVS
jgi:hypothetical protein